MHSTKVSIIIPVYNAAQYLARCMDSVVRQSLKEIEIICINDCSGDNSLEILQHYAQNDERIKIIDCKVNGGESKARNIGLNNAIGEYIAFVDNDDTVDSDFYEKLYNKAKTNDFDISKGQAKLIKYDDSISINDNGKIEKYGKHYFTSCWWSAIYKKDLITKNNIELPEGFVLGGDLLFLANSVIHAKNICITNGTFYNHIMREDSGDSKILSENKVRSAVKIFNIICDKLNNALKNNIIKDYEYNYLYFNYSKAGEYVYKKCIEDDLKTLCAQSIIDNYEKCINKDAVLDEYSKNNFIDIVYLLKNNPEGLFEYISRDDKAKFLFKLRVKIMMEKRHKEQK